MSFARFCHAWGPLHFNDVLRVCRPPQHPFSVSSERWEQETPSLRLLNLKHSVSYGRLTPPSALENSCKARHSSRDRLRRLSWRRGASLPIIQKWTWGSEKCHASENIPIIIIIMTPFFGKVTESMLQLRYSGTAGFSPYLVLLDTLV